MIEEIAEIEGTAGEILPKIAEEKAMEKDILTEEEKRRKPLFFVHIFLIFKCKIINKHSVSIENYLVNYECVMLLIAFLLYIV
ncbi:hypothetical protein JCM15579A_12460 [Marinifilum fragile]